MTRCDLPSVQCTRCRVTVRGEDVDKPLRCVDRDCPLNKASAEAKMRAA